MTHMPSASSVLALDNVRRNLAVFESSWMLTTVLAATLAVLCWYFRLAHVNLAPIIWGLAGLALTQLVLSSQTHRAGSLAWLHSYALISHLLGTVIMGIVWHFFGGVQQPVFPLLIILPLIPAALVMGFWQRQLATLAFVALLASGILLSPDTNSFIAQRYGLRLPADALLPAWLPRSAIAFPDVSTSPAYDLVVTAVVAVVGVAVNATAHVLVGLCRRATDRATSLEVELARLHRLNTELITRMPSADVLVSSSTGRIVNASERFIRTYDGQGSDERFLLDTIEFEYPAVIRQLMVTGGEQVQEAKVRGQVALLRVRAERLGGESSQLAALNIENCDDLCWQGAVNALDEPVFAIDFRGDVVFLNRAALALFGEPAPRTAASLFAGDSARWWDIAPLDCARRVLGRGTRQYMAVIRRERVAASVGELSFVHLRERT